MNNNDMLWSKLNRENLEAMHQIEKGNYKDYVYVQSQMCEFLINEGKHYEQALKVFCQSTYYKNNVLAVCDFRLGYDTYDRILKGSGPKPKLSDSMFFDIKSIKKIKEELNLSDDSLFNLLIENFPRGVPPYANKIIIPFEVFPRDDLAGIIVSKINGRNNTADKVIEKAEKKLSNCKSPLWSESINGKSRKKSKRFSATVNVQSTPKSQMKAFLLCLFFGIFGAHWFYLGRSGKGLLYLCTLGLGCVGWLIDTFRLFLGLVMKKQ